MSNRFIAQAAPGLAALQPYVPGKPLSALEREYGITDSVKLASNENPLGPSPRAVAAIQAQLGDLTRYPDGGAFELRNALARHHDVDPLCITVGNGSNDVLDMLARAFLWAGRESLFSQYAFAVYPLSSMAVGASLVIAPALDFGHDLAAMRGLVSADTGVIWIANPNNPTGTRIDRDTLRAFLEDIPATVIVVVDEAYFEYVHAADHADASRWLDTFPNLVVTRTFSKAYGLAALRVGYGLSHPDVADLLNRVRQPFNVDSLAQAGAIAALDDRDYLRRSVELNDAGMRQLVDGIGKLGLEAIPSSGNFLTIDLGREAEPVDTALLEQGVVTRPVGNYGLPNHLRVSVGLAYENERFLKALGRVLSSLPIGTLAVIGVGLIGGSLARALRDADAVGHIVGCGRSRTNLERAVELGVVDRYTHDVADAVAGADVVFMAVPLGAMRATFAAMRGALPDAALITDGGSAKGSVVDDCRDAAPELLARFVPGHPIAGTEKNGVAASFAGLYRNRRVILTPLRENTPHAIATVRAMWEACGAEVTEMPVVHHDEVLAATSHLPHMLAFGLVDMLARLKENDEIFRYAAGGFRDFTRIASSNPVMWRDICIANRAALGPMLAGFAEEMNTLAARIGDADGEALLEIFERARAARDRYVDGTG